MIPALVVLSDRDTDAPALPGIATVSRTDSWDRGAWQQGVDAASRGALWCDRPYFTGNPALTWLAHRGREATEAGAAAVQAGNEIDLEYEGWQGGIENYIQLWVALHEFAPAVSWLWQPPSGLANLSAWIRPATRYAVHAYGSYVEMRDRVQWYLDHTDGEIWITECNPGAGQAFDLDVWSRNDLQWFLGWCSRHDRIKLVAYFAWRWDLSRTLPASIDAAGTAVATVLQAWQPSALGAEQSTPQPVTPEQLGPGFWALYEQLGHKTGAPIEGTWSVMRDGESGGSVLEVVRFANGRATWDRESNCVVYVGRDRLVMRAYDGRVDVLLPR